MLVGESIRRMNARLVASIVTGIPVAYGVAQEQEQGQEGGNNQTGQSAVEQYDVLLRDIAGLQVYNALLERQIQDQQQQVEQIRAAMEQVPELERQIPALLIRMVDALEQFVARSEERRVR